MVSAVELLEDDDELEDEELVGACSATLALLGHASPRLRSQFLLTSITAISTTTSGRALSRSLISFCASINSSGVPRTTRAFWLATPYTLMLVSTLRSAVVTSFRSFCCQAFVR